MALSIGVAAEQAEGEQRVAFVPEVAQRLARADIEVRVERGAGARAFHTEADYVAAGAHVVSREEALAADVVVAVQADALEPAALREGQVLVGLMQPLDRPERVRVFAEHGVTTLAMELVPRISRAQKMDALSAMSSLAGYRAVLKAALALPKFFPLLTTAAGTIRPADVLVLGAGVAGLQAIATARRLGARVKGYDIREAVREEVQSLGAKFVELDLEVEGEGEGGYARALMEEKAKQQTKLLVPFIGEADVVVTTALIPGRPAPMLVTDEALQAMDPGSVVVDLAAPNGGNCAATEPGQTVTAHGVQVVGPLNLPAEMPVHASQLYARTVLALLEAFIDEGAFHPNFEDEVFAGACVTHDGEVVHERVRQALGAG